VKTRRRGLLWIVPPVRPDPGQACSSREVVTVEVNWPRRLPGTLIQTFASRLDISIPTDRSWTMSIAVALSDIEGIWARDCRGEGRE
jgi:hypothetical protein